MARMAPVEIAKQVVKYLPPIEIIEQAALNLIPYHLTYLRAGFGQRFSRFLP